MAGHKKRNLQINGDYRDMDSSVSPPYGHQGGSVYNSYFECTCYMD
jgi:hypothetical protein